MKVHFIAIGGSVMHQLAIALKRKGYQVTGTDDEIFEPSYSNLQHEGLLPDSMGWNTDLVTPDLDAVILGMHARADNPEILKAQELGLPIYSFPEFIYKESTSKTRVVVGGSHGKTTTTSMMMHVLRQVGQAFDYLVGARLQGFDQSVNITDAPVIVCEGDEYPASVIEKQPKFHFLFPDIAIITGIAWDHINVFPTFDIYLEQFAIFIEKITRGGTLIYNEADDELNRLIEKTKRSDISYKPYNVLPHQIDHGKTMVTIGSQSTTLQVFGDHNLLNMHAAWLACEQLGVTDMQFAQTISNFSGASKRLEKIAESATSIAFRDFAHAPSKVKATVGAVRQQFPNRRLFAVLELHTFSSLNAGFISQYAHTLAAADEAAVFYSGHALELKRMPQLPKELVATGFAKPGLQVLTHRNELEKWLQQQHYHDGVLLLMSSGNFDGLEVVQLAKQCIEG